MSYDYSKIRKTAGGLIDKFGTPVSIRRTAQNTTTPWDPVNGSYVDYQGSAVIMEFTEKFIDGEIVKQGDKKVLLSAQGLDVTPGMADRFICDSKSYSIRNVEPLAPAGTVVLYELHIRP